MEDILSKLLDSGWIFGVLGSIIGIYIFLISLPAIIFQFSLHPEVRQIYFERFKSVKKIKKSFSFFTLLVIIFILVLSNPGLKYYIEATIYFSEIQKKVLFYSYYFLTLFLFLFFFLAANIQINKWMLKNSILVDVLNDICKSIKTDYNNSLRINMKDIGHLKFLTGAINEPSDKDYFLEKIRRMANEICLNANYDGAHLEILIRDVIINGLLNTPNLKNSVDIKKIMDIVNTMEIYSTSKHSAVDLRSIKQTYFKIAKYSLELEDYELLSNVSDKLFTIHNSFDIVEQICKMQIDKGLYQQVATKSYRYLIRFKESSDIIEKFASLRTSIVLFSWLYNVDNNQLKKFTNTKLKPIIAAKLVSINDFQKVEDSYYNTSNFYTAECIRKLIVYLFETNSTL